MKIFIPQGRKRKVIRIQTKARPKPSKKSIKSSSFTYSIGSTLALCPAWGPCSGMLWAPRAWTTLPLWPDGCSPHGYSLELAHCLQLPSEVSTFLACLTSLVLCCCFGFTLIVSHISWSAATCGDFSSATYWLTFQVSLKNSVEAPMIPSLYTCKSSTTWMRPQILPEHAWTTAAASSACLYSWTKAANALGLPCQRRAFELTVWIIWSRFVFVILVWQGIIRIASSSTSQRLFSSKIFMSTTCTDYVPISILSSYQNNLLNPAIAV